MHDAPGVMDVQGAGEEAEGERAGRPEPEITVLISGKA